MSYQIGGGGGGPSGPAPSQPAPQQMRISTTQTVTVAPPRTTTQQPTLRLRGEVRGPEERTEQGRRIQWAEDVVDNEGLGRKSSKVCCIYHAPKQNIDDSSSESDSSSSSDSDSSGADDGSARPVGGAKRGRAKKHKHGDECGKRKPSPNAYEKMPKVKPRGGGEVEKK